MKSLKFKAHFNRCNMQRGLPRVWTVHHDKTCYQVEEIEIRVPVKTVFKAEGRQPRAYLSGYGHVIIQGGIKAVIF
jgi:hypothetical protein